MIKHIVFDFDGVIHDSLHIHLETMREVFDLHFTPEEYAGFLDGNFIDSPIGKLDWDAYHLVLAPKYQSTIFSSDIISQLHTLSQQYVLSINSTGNDDMLKLIIGANKISSLFSEIWGANTAQYKTDKFAMLMKKYDLQPQEIIFVTDTLGDIREANSVGIPTIAITGGFHNRDRLLQGNTVAIVDSWQDLMANIRLYSR